MEQVAKAFKGKKVSPDVNVLIVPASREILGQMEERGWTKIIRDAGATILNPGCGSCFGAHEGLITPRDVCVSTTNRNFPGRMGSKVGQIYLAEPGYRGGHRPHGRHHRSGGVSTNGKDQR